MLDKIDKKRRDRLTNTELLGAYMISSGNDFGPGTSYGNHYLHYLISTSQYIFDKQESCMY